MKKLILKWLFGHDFEEYCAVLNLASSVNTEAKDILDKFTSVINCAKEVNELAGKVIEENMRLRKENAELGSKLLHDELYISDLEEENAKLKTNNEDDIK